MHNQPQRILVVRPDRLGDVMLSTPVVGALRRRYPHAYISFLIQKSIAPVLEGLKSLDAIIGYEPSGRHQGLKGWLRLKNEIAEGEFDTAIILQSTRRVSMAVFFARVPVRIGPFGKVHSYFILNRGIRQKRSEARCHEAVYNLELLEALDDFSWDCQKHEFMTQAAISRQTQDFALGWLVSQRFDPQQTWVAIHPGMGGSALNWPEPRYLDLIRSSLKLGWRVLVTGGPAESALLKRLEQGLNQNPASQDAVLFFHSDSQTHSRSIDFLGALYLNMNAVVAPSTGPLHLAVALGRPAVGIYPPIRVQSPDRWGPYNGTLTEVLTPQVQCPAVFKCLGSQCSSFPCMDSIEVSTVISKLIQLVSSERLSNSSDLVGDV